MSNPSDADLYSLSNSAGVRVSITNFGGIIVELKTPDRRGRVADIVLGFERLEDYAHNPAYFGALIGRYANRIANARFELDGVRYRLSANDGPNALHGGARGFDRVLWTAEHFVRAGAEGVVLRHTSPDGDQGFPGSLRVEVVYTLNDQSELRVEYRATTDRPTVVNLTQHSYFNLSGNANENVLAHEVAINADYYLPVDAALLPTGAIASVIGSRFDFRTAAAVGSRLCDHNFILRRSDAGLVPAAHAYHPPSGRLLELFTTEPGLQFYTGNFLDGSLVGKRGCRYAAHAGLAFEPQHFPDSPNRREFPSVTLRPGENYCSTSLYRFQRALTTRARSTGRS